MTEVIMWRYGCVRCSPRQSREASRRRHTKRNHHRRSHWDSGITSHPQCPMLQASQPQASAGRGQANHRRRPPGGAKRASHHASNSEARAAFVIASQHMTKHQSQHPQDIIAGPRGADVARKETPMTSPNKATKSQKHAP